MVQAGEVEAADQQPALADLEFEEIAELAHGVGRLEFRKLEVVDVEAVAHRAVHAFHDRFDLDREIVQDHLVRVVDQIGELHVDEAVVGEVRPGAGAAHEGTGVVAAVPDDRLEAVPGRRQIVFFLGRAHLAVAGHRDAVHHPGVAALGDMIDQRLAETVGDHELCAGFLGELRITHVREDFVELHVDVHLREGLRVVRETPEVPVVVDHGLAGFVDQLENQLVGRGLARRGHLERQFADVVAAAFDQVDVREVAAQHRVALGVLKREPEGHHARKFRREVGHDHRNQQLFAFEEDPARHIRQQHGVAVELAELDFVDALLVVETVDDAIGVFIAVGVAELEEMEAAEILAPAGRFEAQLPGQQLETVGSFLHQVVLAPAESFERDQLLQFADPPRLAFRAELVEFLFQGVEIAQPGVMADFVRQHRTARRHFARDLPILRFARVLDDHRNARRRTGDDPVLRIFEHVVAVAPGIEVAHVLNVEVDAAAVEFAAAAGVEEEARRIELMGHFVEFLADRIAAGMIDFVAHAVDHQTGAVAQALDHVDPFVAVEQRPLGVHGGTFLLVLAVVLAHFDVDQDTEIVGGLEAFHRRHEGMEADEVEAVELHHAHVFGIVFVHAEIGQVRMVVGFAAADHAAQEEVFIVEVERFGGHRIFAHPEPDRALFGLALDRKDGLESVQIRGVHVPRLEIPDRFGGLEELLRFEVGRAARGDLLAFVQHFPGDLFAARRSGDLHCDLAFVVQRMDENIIEVFAPDILRNFSDELEFFFLSHDFFPRLHSTVVKLLPFVTLEQYIHIVQSRFFSSIFSPDFRKIPEFPVLKRVNKTAHVDKAPLV
ncbi:hypothetical protein SDC9_85892 [bioreactor metagenome]|uniref:Uncharacterized protein n=1 Tax=bioreactor metagenome TaxID=1076179 RepID=A0A644ZER5_9ZZZZ